MNDIRKKLLERLGAANQKHTDATQADHEIAKLFSSLSDEDIAQQVRRIKIELYQNREAMREIEVKNSELGMQLSAIQTHCPHPNEEVDSEGSMELRTCKLCCRSRTLNYSTSHLHGKL